MYPSLSEIATEIAAPAIGRLHTLARPDTVRLSGPPQIG